MLVMYMLTELKSKHTSSKDLPHKTEMPFCGAAHIATCHDQQAWVCLPLSSLFPDCHVAVNDTCCTSLSENDAPVAGVHMAVGVSI